jgi:hypothetical protein
LNSVVEKKNTEIKLLKENDQDAEGLSRQVKQLSDQLKRLTNENEGIFN